MEVPARGRGRTPARVPDGAKSSGLRELADREGFLVAFPDAETRFAGTLVGLLGGYPRGWSVPGCSASPSGGRDACGRRPTCELAGALWQGTVPEPGEGGEAQACATSKCNTAKEAERCAAAGGCTNDSPCNWCPCRDDAGFIRRVVEHVAGIRCVDLSRLYLNGYSSGAMMAWHLAGQADAPFAAYSTYAGVDPRDFFTLPARDAAVGLLHFHGRADMIVPFDGSPSLTLGSVFEDVERRLRRTKKRFKCRKGFRARQWERGLGAGLPGLRCRRFVDCASARGEVALCSWAGVHVSSFPSLPPADEVGTLTQPASAGAPGRPGERDHDGVLEAVPEAGGPGALRRGVRGRRRRAGRPGRAAPGEAPGARQGRLRPVPHRGARARVLLREGGGRRASREAAAAGPGARLKGVRPIGTPWRRRGPPAGRRV